ncbi:sucrase ferredoxin, partial [Streptomyces althioticus]|uniref:sucrase ferredoxin n=1 Tax=Streptomyces althioticus TaxID=83380 RepID=UPI003700E59E
MDEDGAVASVLLAHLLSAPSFALADAPTPSRVPPLGLLEELPEQAREHAMAWQRHVREVETGFPTADTSGVPRREFDPAQRTLAQREAAKAAELAAAGHSEVWEVTHLGGHRFAPTMLVLPYGYAYGRLTPESAKDVLAATAAGHMVPEWSR